MDKVNITLDDIRYNEKVSIPAGASLKKTVHLMSQNEHGVVVILEGKKPVGIMTERDVVRLLYSEVDLSLSVDQFMTRPLIMANGSRTIGYALNLMLENNIRRLLVTEETAEGKRAVGVISTTDVIRDMREQPWFW